MSWLARGTVTVAVTSIRDVDGPALSRVVEKLSPEERARAARFRHEDDHARFVLGRLLLRDLAAQALGVGADSVRIGAEQSGRPIVLESPSEMFVSIAHSGRYVVAAIARRPVGVDVEQYRTAALRPELVARVCSPAELRRLDSLSPARCTGAFMAIWVRKEAYGKALGVGIGFGLRSVTVGPTGRRVRGAPGRWKVVNLDVGPDYAGAVVAAGRRWRTTVRKVDAAGLLRR